MEPGFIDIYGKLLLFPILLILWQFMGKEKSKAAWILRTAVLAIFFVEAFFSARWIVLSLWLRYVYAVFFLAAVGTSFFRHLRQPWWSRPALRGWITAAGLILVAAAVLPAMQETLGARRLPAQPLDLVFPLRGGEYYVLEGGSARSMNYHLAFGTGKERNRRGEIWALDLVKLNAYGRGAEGFSPSQLERYAIFGEPIYAPCTGTIQEAQDGSPDMTPPAGDRLNGNTIIIHCEAGSYVIMHHLRRGSVNVKRGDHVTTGEQVGAVGNSGNSTGPHLHIHAQVGLGMNASEDADAVPMTFNRRFLIRNDVVKN